MKTLWCSLLTLVLAFPAFADNWECMSKEEAKAVEALLTKKMPYLLDYCDCCEVDASLVRVRSVQIIPCEYEEDMYTVAVTGELLAILPYTGAAFDEVIPADEDTGDLFEGNVSLNYSFGVNEDGSVQTIAGLIDAKTWNDEPCQASISYPDPTAVENESYTAWFQKAGLK